MGKVGCTHGTEFISMAHIEEPGMAKCAYNPRPREVESGGFLGHAGQHIN